MNAPTATINENPAADVNIDAIDPRLRRSTGGLDVSSEDEPIKYSTVIIGDAVLGQTDDQSFNVALSCDLLDDSPSPATEDLVVPTFEFINKFSQINIVRSWKSLDKTGYLVTGGSRSEPTRFRYTCKNAIYGCVAGAFTTLDKSNHERICTLTSEEAHQEHLRKQQLATFQCTWEGCLKSFKSKVALTSHVWHAHKKVWVPVPCGKGCDPSKLYRSETAYKTHLRDTHGNYAAQRCPIPECEHPTVFDKQAALWLHMSKVHQLNTGEAKKLIVYST